MLLIEEPELFLRPQSQRYLYRLLRQFAEAGNQVLYSTHSAAFLDVGRLDELALVDWGPIAGTTIVQPEPLPGPAGFRALSELDAERSELFLARGGAARRGPHREDDPAVRLPRARPRRRPARRSPSSSAAASRTCRSSSASAGRPACRSSCCTTATPPPGKKPNHGERILNARIQEAAGPENVVLMTPDFEGVAGLRSRHHKPERALAQFATITRDDVPEPIRRAIERVVDLAGR